MKSYFSHFLSSDSISNFPSYFPSLSYLLNSHTFPHLISHPIILGVSCQEGEVVYGVVLDNNIDNMIADITLMPKIVEERRKEMGETPKKKKVSSLL